ncbi:MAG TPA: hypothetical protein VF103_05395, partial [Polyangiaceae bacterium]
RTPHTTNLESPPRRIGKVFDRLIHENDSSKRFLEPVAVFFLFVRRGPGPTGSGFNQQFPSLGPERGGTAWN